VVVIKPELEVHLPRVFGNVGGLPEPRWEWRVGNVLAEDPRSWGFRRWAPVLPIVIAATPVRVVAMASTILLMPLGRIEDIVRVVVVADVVMDGWGLYPAFCCSRWTEDSFSHGANSARWLGLGPRRRDTELSTCYTIAHSRRKHNSSWACRPSGVNGLGIDRRRIVMATMFWLVQAKSGG
jgi:hypothetical protein